MPSTSTVDALRTKAAELAAVTNSSASTGAVPISSADDELLEDLVDEISLLVLELQNVNRLAHMQTRNCKTVTSEAKQDIDKLYLSVQNLNYERTHLKREIAKCREFETIYQNVDLQPLEDFQALAGELATGAQDEHSLMLNRLQFEKAERERLAAEELKLKEEKEALAKQVLDNAKELDTLDRELEALMDSTGPLQQKMGLTGLPEITSLNASSIITQLGEQLAAMTPSDMTL